MDDVNARAGEGPHDWVGQDQIRVHKWLKTQFDLIADWKLHPREVQAAMLEVIQCTMMDGREGLESSMAQTICRLEDLGLVDKRGNINR